MTKCLWKMVPQSIVCKSTKKGGENEKLFNRAIRNDWRGSFNVEIIV